MGVKGTVESAEVPYLAPQMVIRILEDGDRVEIAHKVPAAATPPEAAMKAVAISKDILKQLPATFSRDEHSFAANVFAVASEPSSGSAVEFESLLSRDSKNKVMLFMLEKGVIAGFGFTMNHVPVAKVSETDKFDDKRPAVYNWKDAESIKKAEKEADAIRNLGIVFPEDFTADEKSCAHRVLIEWKKRVPEGNAWSCPGMQDILLTLESRKRVMNLLLAQGHIAEWGLGYSGIPCVKAKSSDRVPVIYSSEAVEGFRSHVATWIRRDA